VGGHSLGGVVASEIAYFNTNKVKGVILLASFPIFNFKNKNIDFLDIRAENDKILSPRAADTGIRMMVHKKNINRVDIDGGNHSYFGYYGDQQNDGRAQITREKQQYIITKSILSFIRK
jgi:alpha-beta hydrolase superfamily lysophospholipase